MPEITVVIPNYNGIAFLEDCLNSVLAQEPGTPEYDVLVVDNGSKDGSRELVTERYPQIRLHELPENTGFCHAVNIGIRQVDSPYVILLNNDTKVRAGFVKNLFRAIEEREKAFSVSAAMLMWDNPELLDDAGDRYCVLGWAFARGKGRQARLYSRPCEIFSACGGAAIYRKAVFEEIGCFDEEHFAYLEDLDIGYRAKIYGYHNYYEPAAEVIHYGSASSGSRYNEWKTSLAAANSVYVIGKNMPLLQWFWNLPFLAVGFLVKFLFFTRKRMGKIYLRGLKDGFRKLFSEAGKAHKVYFRPKHLGSCFAIQWQLYLNLFRFLKKY
ncbi:MAG: glycosyltransferase family 2 protein [bacterium]|nr:glycosyltransferase family 2 protein [bacterium]